jgi:hypothetical protein
MNFFAGSNLQILTEDIGPDWTAKDTENLATRNLPQSPTISSLLYQSRLSCVYKNHIIGISLRIIRITAISKLIKLQLQNNT